MTKQTEALKLALEALEVSTDWDLSATGKQGQSVRAIIALRKALAEDALQRLSDIHQEMEQEPVAWYGVNIAGVKYLGWKYEELDDRGFDVFPLYTAPPQRTWVGLTDEEFQWIYDHGRTPAGMMELVEAKLKEKNT